MRRAERLVSAAVGAALGALALGSAAASAGPAAHAPLRTDSSRAAPAHSAKGVPPRGGAPLAKAAQGGGLRAPGPATATLSRQARPGTVTYPAPARGLASRRSIMAARPASQSLRIAGVHAGVIGGPAHYNGRQGGVLTGAGLKRRPTSP